jgi:1-deoxyxylulose-5-phosphate synthase
MATEAGELLPKLAVAWIIASTAIISVQLNDTLTAANYRVAPELKTKVDEVSAEYRRGDARWPR